MSLDGRKACQQRQFSERRGLGALGSLRPTRKSLSEKRGEEEREGAPLEKGNGER